MASRRAESASRFFGGFYARRLKRLTPSLVVVFLTAAVACALLPAESEAEQDRESLEAGLFALFGMSNVYYSVVLERDLASVKTRVILNYGGFHLTLSTNPYHSS